MPTGVLVAMSTVSFRRASASVRAGTGRSEQKPETRDRKVAAHIHPVHSNECCRIGRRGRVSRQCGENVLHISSMSDDQPTRNGFDAAESDDNSQLRTYSTSSTRVRGRGRAMRDQPHPARRNASGDSVGAPGAARATYLRQPAVCSPPAPGSMPASTSESRLVHNSRTPSRPRENHR